MIETIFDTLNAKAGIMAYEEYFEESGKEKLPLFVRLIKQFLIKKLSLLKKFKYFLQFLFQLNKLNKTK